MEAKMADEDKEDEAEEADNAKSNKADLRQSIDCDWCETYFQCYNKCTKELANGDNFDDEYNDYYDKLPNGDYYIQERLANNCQEVCRAKKKFASQLPTRLLEHANKW